MRLFLKLALTVAALLLVLIGLTVQPLFRQTKVIAVPAVSPERLKAHVRMLSETLHPRSVEELTNLEAAASYIHTEFTATGAVVADQWFTDRGEKYRNVIARFGPAEGPLLVIGAHYDSFETTPGADDNASGVAGLIELAAFSAVIRRNGRSSSWPIRTKSRRISDTRPWAAPIMRNHCGPAAARSR